MPTTEKLTADERLLLQFSEEKFRRPAFFQEESAHRLLIYQLWTLLVLRNFRKVQDINIKIRQS